MTNFIIEGSTDAAKIYIEKFLEAESFKPHNIIYFDFPVKIEETREIKKTLSFVNHEKRVFVFLNGMSHEAQNSLLKATEESENSYFIFRSSTSGEYLPTIYSRCKIIKIEEEIALKGLDELLINLHDFGYQEIEKIYESCGNNLSVLVPTLRSLILNDKVPNEEKRKYYIYLKRLFEVYVMSKVNNVNSKYLLEYIFAPQITT